MSTKPLLIFIAGPYNSPEASVREENVKCIQQIAKVLISKGHFVLECHSLEHALRGTELKHAEFLRQTLNWLKRCDAIFFAAPSPGANMELRKAEELGLPVFKNLEEVPPVLDRSQELAVIEQMLAL